MKLLYFLALAIIAAALTCPLTVQGADILCPIVPSSVGINIHFTRGHEHDLDLIAAAGFKFVREDFFWTTTEPNKGHYDWSEYDDLERDLRQRGMRAYFILDYSNPLYENDVTGINPLTGKPENRTIGSPQHPESVAAFARWAAAAAKHFQGRGVIWEIWNEPNIGFWKPKPNADQYAALVMATCRAIRKANPHATIVAPASSGFPWKFIEALFQAGALKYLDAVSVHPYRPPSVPPETAAADYRQLRALIDKFAPSNRKKIPIFSGEWGYSSNTRGVSPERQAEFIARQQLSNLLCGVPLSIWYDWKNDGDDPAENEHNFGIVKSDLTPKPAYHSIQILTRELAGYHLDRRLKTGNANDFILVFKKAWGHTKLAAWTTGPVDEATILLHKSTMMTTTFTNGAGDQGTVAVADGKLIIPLDGDPKYVDVSRFELSF